MGNSFKCYSCSFSDVLVMRIASAASLQMMADHSRETSGERKMRDFQSVCDPHRLKTGLAGAPGGSVGSVFPQENDSISFSGHCIEPYPVALTKPLSFLYITNHVSYYALYCCWNVSKLTLGIKWTKPWMHDFIITTKLSNILYTRYNSTSQHVEKLDFE